MKRFKRIVIVLGLILGGITIAYFYFNHSDEVTYVQEIKDTVSLAPVPVKEPTAEEKAEAIQFAEIMKIKEQEARLEAKRNVQKEELRVKSADFEAQIEALKKEYTSYTTGKEAEIKATEAELASFIKATGLSKN